MTCGAFLKWPGGLGYQYESSETLNKELEIDLGGEVLEKGTHA